MQPQTPTHPIHPSTNKRDRRYRLAREWCGQTKPQWVVRFCDAWVGCAPKRQAALVIALAHQAARQLHILKPRKESL